MSKSCTSEKACLDRWRTNQCTEITKMHTTINHTHNIQKWTKKIKYKRVCLERWGLGSHTLTVDGTGECTNAKPDSLKTAPTRL